MSNALDHVAIIMDGNSRWGDGLGYTRWDAYRAGSDNSISIIKHAIKMEIRRLTLFVFSMENWGRSNEDVCTLFKLFSRYLTDYVGYLREMEVCIKFIGEIYLLPKTIQKYIRESEEQTRDNKNFFLNIAISYGARDEILNAVREIIKKGVNHEDITCNLFNDFLYTRGMSDPDLIIRTGGEMRLSNFLLWQSAYSELYFSKKLWPDFDELEFNKAIDSYHNRNRRYGK